MNKSRRLKDGILNGLTWLSTAVAVAVLLLVFIFMFRRGWSDLSWDLITTDYWPQNLNVAFRQGEAGAYTAPADLAAGDSFSTLYGFALRDATDTKKAKTLIITYVDPDSPLESAYITTAGSQQGLNQAIHEDASVQMLYYQDEDGQQVLAGLLAGDDAASLVQKLDTGSVSIQSMYYQTAGGGIRGSILATLLLIGLTLVIVLPIGILAAVYLNEVAGRNRLTALLRQAIETLNGVPSIIFGLSGVVMLFPVTQLFGASGQSILLGALTMAVILLPVVIRQTEEALIVVPQSLRMGSLALGATRSQTIFKVVLPNALPGILTATLLSVSRVIGESAALIYTMSTVVTDNPKILQPATSLAVQIWQIMSSEQPDFKLASAVSLIILMMVLLLNLTVKLITRRLSRRWA
ncbi:phosphate ABC transporter permease PstA [Oscillospiraceae bacterium HV4-5-C5C]|nr:phosphate ABC transporter permease PstA [Oscillospiraceae bacterium HV4-5-C5C]